MRAIFIAVFIAFTVSLLGTPFVIKLFTKLKAAQPIRTDAPPDTTVRRAPMGLILRYLVTPWSDDRLTDQQMLGCALRAMRDHAIIAGPRLRGGLAGTTEALKVTLNPLNLEERTRIWNAVHKPYRVSVAYEVRVVNLDSLVERRVLPVATRILDGAIPEAG